MRSRKLWAAVVGVAAVGISAGVPALAAQQVVRYDGRYASTYWTQVDGTPQGSRFGNVHVGFLDAYENEPGLAGVFAFIADWDCPAGQLPPTGHSEEPAACSHIGVRQGFGENLTFSMDDKMETAHLGGTLTMTVGGGHDGPGEVVGNPPVDITWTAVGRTYKSLGTYHTIGNGYKYFNKSRNSTRESTMSGRLGPMGFDPSLSGGNLGKYADLMRIQGGIFP